MATRLQELEQKVERLEAEKKKVEAEKKKVEVESAEERKKLLKRVNEAEKTKKGQTKGKRRKRSSGFARWKEILDEEFDEDEIIPVLCAALGDVDVRSCDRDDISMALGEHKNELPGHVDFKELLETLSNLVKKQRRSWDYISTEKELMADDVDLAPQDKRVSEATFFYLGIDPIKATVKIPNLRACYSVKELNGYNGKVIFKDIRREFTYKGKNVYLFVFQRDRTRCSAVNSEAHDILFRNVTFPIVDEGKFKENIFTGNSSPGKAFYEVQPGVVVKSDGNKLVLEQPQVVVSQVRIHCNAVPEFLLTHAMAKELIKNNPELEVLLTDEIRSETSPFSGGGDIVVFKNENSAVVQTALDMNSPCDVNEVKTHFNFELKVAERVGDSVARQLLANMMVVVSMSMEKLINVGDEERIRNLKRISTYGLAMDQILPLQLYKLTLNFENSSLEIVNKYVTSPNVMPFEYADRLITFMLKNIMV